MKKSDQTLSSMDYFLQYVHVEGKPLTREQKERWKKEIALLENNKPGTVIGKRRGRL